MVVQQILLSGAFNILWNWAFNSEQSVEWWKASIIIHRLITPLLGKAVLSGNHWGAGGFIMLPLYCSLLPAEATGTRASRWDVSVPVTHYFLKYWQQSPSALPSKAFHFMGGPFLHLLMRYRFLSDFPYSNFIVTPYSTRMKLKRRCKWNFMSSSTGTSW